METLSKHFRSLTQAAFARHGFAQADLAQCWAEIAGPELAQCSRPERIRWPRGTGEDRQKEGGTLVVRAAAGRLLELEYDGPRLIGRINAFLGYCAIARLRVLPDQKAAAPPRSGTQKPTPAAAPQPVTGIEDGDLRSALERLALAVATGRTSPQPQ
jgi:hypothetical protein